MFGVVYHKQRDKSIKLNSDIDGSGKMVTLRENSDSQTKLSPLLLEW